MGSRIRARDQAGDHDDAIATAFQAGDLHAAIELMEKKGAYFDAARTALEMNETELCVRLLQRVSVHDPSYGESCIALTKLFAEGDEPELALRKLEDAIEAFSVADLPALREQVAGLFEERGQLEAAIDALEAIRRHDGAYPGVAERIEKLRARLLCGDAGVGAAAAADPASAAPLDARYEIGRELGRGAMGIVYKARDRYLDRVVALKCLPDDVKDRPTAVALFLSEARMAAALDHENIVRYLEVDHHDGVYYLTMEYLEGSSLDVTLKRTRPSVADTLRISAQIAAGIAYAHSKGIVHRDIKPANLFYTRARQVKVMDFGLAKLIEEVRGATSVIEGTPSYMAPEQESGDPIDHRADQYALGVTMFELATGRLPFRSNVAHNHRVTRPPDPREFAAEIPDGLAELILRLMSKHPGDRFANSDEIVNLLEGLLRDAKATA